MEIMRPNITLIPNFNSGELFDFIINNCDFDRTMKSRWTTSFGKSYDYNGMTYPAIPFPDNFTELLNSINDTIGFLPNNCLINLYHDGNSSMGYHSDNTDILTTGTGVVIISLGSDRILRFKNKLDPNIIVDYTLSNGSLFYMNDEVQNDWLHSIPKSDTTSPRLSLTFRNIR
jgi:alkylated DNA repair dioxygenase AlkB